MNKMNNSIAVWNLPAVIFVCSMSLETPEEKMRNSDSGHFWRW